jgi:hypothetical protein
MKTAREFCAEQGWIEAESTIRAIGFRDAEHADVLADVRSERDHLKGELRTMTAMWNGLRTMLPPQIKQLKGELAEARRLLDIVRCEELHTEAEVGDAWMAVDDFLAAPSPAESTPKIRDSLTGQMHEPPRFQDLVHRVGPLPTTQLAGASQSWSDAIGKAASVADVAMANEGVDGTSARYVLAAIRELAPAESTGVSPVMTEVYADEIKEHADRQPAPPDDIEERLGARLRWHDQEFSALDRRLKALEDAGRLAQIHKDWGSALQGMADTPAAPQEQAGHAFECKDRYPKDRSDCQTAGFDCICDCGKRRHEHIGPKP